MSSVHICTHSRASETLNECSPYGAQYFLMNQTNITPTLLVKITQAKGNHIDPVPYFSTWRSVVWVWLRSCTWEYQVSNPDHYLGNPFSFLSACLLLALWGRTSSHAVQGNSEQHTGHGFIIMSTEWWFFPHTFFMILTLTPLLFGEITAKHTQNLG